MLTVSNERIKTYYGLSTDTKPSKYVDNGTVFYEMDTHHYFIFDQGARQWLRYNPNGVPISANSKGDVTSRLKTIEIDEVVYSIDPTAGGMVDYLYQPKDGESYLSTVIGNSTTINQKSVGTGSEKFDLFEQVYDLHGTFGYISAVDDDANTISVITMTTGASVNDEIITKESTGGIPAGTNIQGMSPTDLVVASTAPTKVSEVITNVGGSITGPTSLNTGEKIKVSSITPNFEVGGQGDVNYIKVEAKPENGTAVTLYETTADTSIPYVPGKVINLTKPYTLDGKTDTDIVVTIKTEGNQTVNPATKVETIAFVYDGRDYYGINSNESAAPAKTKWITLNGSEYEITVKEDEVIWFMLPDQSRVLQQYAMGTWANSDWYLITYDSANKVYKYNTGALYAGTYKFRLV